MTWTLAVLLGGPSPERAISLETGHAMATALRERGHRVETFDLDPTTYAALQALKPDCVVNALHGVPGEDGSVQGMLELLGMPYTGSGVAASAIAIDKVLTKRIAATLGIPLATDCVVASEDVEATRTAIQAAGLHYPLIVKGSTAGSTIGLTKVANDNPELLGAALRVALAVSPVALIEECVMGTEISVCLLGNGTPRVLPTPEIVSQHEIFDYAAKYTPGLSHHVYPPRADAGVVAQAESHAVRLYEAIGCGGCARVDFILTAEGIPICLEINTVPGMTAVSILPDAAQQVGMSFAELCETLVTLGMQRARLGQPCALDPDRAALAPR